eukprot:820105-Pleurochrysis_carterae.AAC.2
MHGCGLKGSGVWEEGEVSGEGVYTRAQHTAARASGLAGEQRLGRAVAQGQRAGRPRRRAAGGGAAQVVLDHARRPLAQRILGGGAMFAPACSRARSFGRERKIAREDTLVRRHTRASCV